MAALDPRHRLARLQLAIAYALAAQRIEQHAAANLRRCM